MAQNKELADLLEDIHLLRKLFIRRISDSSPLHFGQIAIMSTIGQNENCTQAVIAEQLGVTPASVATSTKRLQKAGLITKTIDSGNLRCKRLALTEKGRDAIEHHINQFKEYDETVFSVLTDEEKDTLLLLLRKVAEKMQEAEGIVCDEERHLAMTCCLRHALEKLNNETDNERSDADV
ncbi:MAG: MarR family transcriptional regulator [Ruminococcus sp.]|nr:MarR family transcriptional regulator [Ruminococcus sp.]